MRQQYGDCIVIAKTIDGIEGEDIDTIINKYIEFCGDKRQHDRKVADIMDLNNMDPDKRYIVAIRQFAGHSGSQTRIQTGKGYAWVVWVSRVIDWA